MKGTSARESPDNSVQSNEAPAATDRRVSRTDDEDKELRQPEGCDSASVSWPEKEATSSTWRVSGLKTQPSLTLR